MQAQITENKFYHRFELESQSLLFSQNLDWISRKYVKSEKNILNADDNALARAIIADDDDDDASETYS